MCMQPLRMSKAKPNSTSFLIHFFSHFVSPGSGCPRNLLPTDFREGPSQPGWENKYEHKSHPSAHHAGCETLCRGKGLQVTVWKPSHDLHLLLVLPPREEGLPQGSSCHPAEDWQHRRLLCGNPAFLSHPPSPSSSGSVARSPTSARTCLSGNKTQARDSSPAAGCTAPALQGRWGQSAGAFCSSSRDRLEK